MNKLNGTSGQLFSVIAETINSRATGRSGKGAGGQNTGASSFLDLLHTVSAKRASGDQGNEHSTKPLRTHGTLLTAREELQNETKREHLERAKDSNSTNKISSLDQEAKMDVESRLNHSSVVTSHTSAIVGQELAVVP